MGAPERLAPLAPAMPSQERRPPSVPLEGISPFRTASPDAPHDLPGPEASHVYAGQNFKAPCPSYRGGAGTVNMKGSPIWTLLRAAGGMANTSVCPAGVWTFT